MKRKYILWTMAAILTAGLAGCQEDDPTEKPPVTPPDPLQVKIGATVGDYTLTRTSLDDDGVTVKWGSNDAIGVYWERNEGIVSEPSKYDIASGSIDNEKGYASFNGSMDWDSGKQQHYIYAYYPYIAHGGNNGDYRQVPVSLTAIQSQNGDDYSNIDGMMNMVAKPIYPIAPDFGEPESNKTVDMEFYPVFSMLEMWMIAFDVPAEITSVKIESADGNAIKAFSVKDAYIDVSTPGFSESFGRVSGGTPNNYVELKLTGADLAATIDPSYSPDTSLPAPSNVFVARVMILPDNYEDGGFKFTFRTADDQTVERQIEGVNIKRGTKYVMPLVVPVTDFGYDQPGAPWDGTAATKPVNFEDKIIYIRSAAELAWIAGVANGTIDITGDQDVDNARFNGYTIKLISNINLDNQEWTPIGIANNSHFEGSFHGNGYKVEGLKISSYTTSSSANSVGLFGYVRGPAVITEANVSGEITLSVGTALHAGGIIGSAYGTAAAPVTVNNSKFSGTITTSSSGGSYIGGIVGNSGGYAIVNRSNSSAALSVSNTATANTSYSGAGGIVGGNNNITVRNSFNEGEVKGLQGAVRAGGIAGYVASGSIYGSRNSAAVSSVGGGSSVGGLVGYFGGTEILSSYNTGNITTGAINAGSNYGTGGIVGTVTSAKTIKGCYSTGTVSVQSGSASVAGNFAGRFVKPFLSEHNYANYSAVYYSNDPLASDQLTALNGKVFKFSESNWPVATMPGWGTGRGTGAETYWKSPLPAFGTVYPQLWWE